MILLWSDIQLAIRKIHLEKSSSFTFIYLKHIKLLKDKQYIHIPLNDKS